MIVVRGKQAQEITRADLEDLIAKHDRVVIDLGAGDGKWAYRQARANRDTLTIAIDPVAENLRETSAKAAKKPDRGGAPNFICVQASVEHLPPELQAAADEISITMPWGSLMRGIILAEPAILIAIGSLAKPDATIHVVLNTRIFDDPIPIEARDLPDVTPEYMRSLDPTFEAAGLTMANTRWLDADEVATLDTTWAKRLSHRRPPRSVLVDLRKA